MMNWDGMSIKKNALHAVVNQALRDMVEIVTTKIMKMGESG